LARRSRRNSPSDEDATAAAGTPAPPEESTPAPGADAADEAASDPRTDKMLRRVVLGVIIAIFIIFQFFVINLFRAGESINWKRELADVRQTFESGDYKKAAEDLKAFGERWPGARETFNWNRQMGEYHAAADDSQTAAEYYARAVQIDDAALARRRQIDPEPRVRALAAETLWKDGQKAPAAKMAQAEIDQVNGAVGDHDRAHFYMALSEKENGNLVAAFQHLQAIAARGQWTAEIQPLYDELEAGFLASAREAAKTTATQQIP